MRRDVTCLLRCLAALAVAPGALLTACHGELPLDHGPAGPTLSIEVAPLDLPQVRGVEYAIAVFNAQPSAAPFDVDGTVAPAADRDALVWEQPSLTSVQFGTGAGGDLAYVGPCDASTPENWVALALKTIAVPDGGGSYDGVDAFPGVLNILDDQNSAFTTTPGSGDGEPDFTNPCPYDAPCLTRAACVENEDTPVSFNLTVMRRAQQGFLDVAVSFDDVFCSSKIDTCYADGAPIHLLFNEAGDRVETAVIAAACSAGVGDDVDTVIWMAPIEVSCADGISFSIDPTGQEEIDPDIPGVPGNHQADLNIMTPEGMVHHAISFALYWGSEDLSCGLGVSCNKAYWNVAINLDDLRRAGLEDCEISTAITASGGPADEQFPQATLAGPGEVYGYIDIDAQVTVGAEPVCVQGPMGSSLAQPRYGTSADMIGGHPFPFMCHYYERGAPSPRSLADIDGYFTAPAATPETAEYAGPAPLFPTNELTLPFYDMGSDTAGPCLGRAYLVSKSMWFGGFVPLDSFTWRGELVGGLLTDLSTQGAYQIDVFARFAEGPWVLRGGYHVDLRTLAGRLAFTGFHGDHTFPLEGEVAVAIVMTRLDEPPFPQVDDLEMVITGASTAP